MSIQEQSIQCVKTLLKSVLINSSRDEDIIFSVVKDINRIIAHALRLLKLYILYKYKYDHQQEIPFLDVKFLRNVMKAVCIKTETRGASKKT